MIYLFAGIPQGRQVLRGDGMKRKPDVMFTLIVVFCFGLVVSGFVAYERPSERPDVHLTMTEALPSDTATR